MLTVPPKKSTFALSRTAMHGPVLSEIRRRIGVSARSGLNASWIAARRAHRVDRVDERGHHGVADGLDHRAAVLAATIANTSSKCFLISTNAAGSPRDA